MKYLILKVLKEQKDGFITPNQADFNRLNTKEFFAAIGELIQEGILRKRNCEGLAYEFNK